MSKTIFIMRYLKTFEQKTETTLFDKVKDVLKGKVKEGGMYFITQSDRFEKLTKLKDQQQQKLDKELNKYGEPMTIGGEAAKQMVDMYNQNLNLLDQTIDQYISRKIDKQGVQQILDKKIKEVSVVPTGFLQDATEFKKSALDLLTWLKSDVTPWLI
jgi:ATP:corrinoid adenosyltransferase